MRGQRHRSPDSKNASGHKVLDNHQQNQSNRGRKQVAGWPGERHQNVVSLVVLEVTSRNRSWLRPANQRPVIDQSQQRHEDRTKRIKVFQWIKRDATKHLGSRVAEAPRCPRVGALVHAEREYQDNNLKDNEDSFLIHTSSSLLKFA